VITRESISPPVVVGVDNSAPALRAVRAAARQAAARGADLHLVHAWAGPTRPHEESSSCSNHGRWAVLDHAAALAREEAPRLTVQSRAVVGSEVAVLLQESRTAGLLVLGHRDLGTRAGRLIGAVGVQLVGRTGCPLLIVANEGDPGGTVIVGVDEPPISDDILVEAFRQAQLAGLPLHVVHAWRVPAPVVPSTMGYGYELVELAESEALAGQLERVGRDFPTVAATCEIRLGRPISVLTETCEGAAILVVGGQESGVVRERVHESVAMAAVAQAPCPVLVVPRPRRAGAPHPSVST
jgi:nucleotide-binding universal stress UspA family protein